MLNYYLINKVLFVFYSSAEFWILSFFICLNFCEAVFWVR